MAKKRAKPAFRVGLLGESPNDTRAIGRLLAPRYGGRAEFFTLIEGITGDMLETEGAFKLLRRECDYERPNLVLIIRDLDGLETDRAQLRKRTAYFRKVNKRVQGIGLPLLNIYSIEALIAADIKAFNDYYRPCHCQIVGDVMTLEKPIDVLRAASQSRYLEGHCADILARANYETLLANCRYFRAFDAAFAAQLPPAASA